MSDGAADAAPAEEAPAEAAPTKEMESDTVPLVKGGAARRCHPALAGAALRGCPGAALGGARKRKCCCATLAVLVALLVTAAIVVSSGLRQVLPLVCSQLQVLALELPDLCAFQIPLRVLVLLTSVAKAGVTFADPFFALEDTDGYPLVTVSVLGSCIQQRLDARCHRLAPSTVARYRAAGWACFRLTDGALVGSACIAGDGSPAPCYDAAAEEPVRAMLPARWVEETIAHGCGRYPPPMPPPSPPPPSEQALARQRAAQRSHEERAARAQHVSPAAAGANPRLVTPGCLQAALDDACGPSEDGLAQHARRRRQLWGCYTTLDYRGTNATQTCVRDGTATPTLCYTGDESGGAVSYGRTHAIGTYLWSLRQPDGSFGCPAVPFAQSETARALGLAPSAREDDGWGAAGGGGSRAGSASGGGGGGAAGSDADAADDDDDGVAGDGRLSPSWLRDLLAPPRVFSVDAGPQRVELLLALRVPDEARLGRALNHLASALGGSVGVRGDPDQAAPRASEPPRLTREQKAAEAADEEKSPRIRVRLSVGLRALGTNFGMHEIDIRLAMTEHRKEQLQRTVRALQRRAGCADCTGLHVATDPNAGPLLEAFKFDGAQLQAANAERTRMHSSMAARFGSVPEFSLAVPPLSLRLCSRRPWQGDASAAAHAYAAIAANASREDAARGARGDAAAARRGARYDLHGAGAQDIVNEDELRNIGGCIGTLETHSSVVQNGISTFDAHVLLSYGGTAEQRVEPLHGIMKISRERQLLLGGTPDAAIAHMRAGDDVMAPLPPASSSCFLQRLLDSVALSVNLDELVRRLVPFEIIAGLDNEVLLDDGLIAATCAVGVTMKLKLNSTSARDEDEIASYCLTALRDFTGIVTSQMNGMVNTWMKGETPHLGASAEAEPRAHVRTVQQYLAVTHDWDSARRDSSGLRSDGREAACRLHEVDEGSRHNYRSASGVGSLEACQELCSAHTVSCSGIEYAESQQRCELWFHRPHMAVPAPGYTCLARVPHQVEEPSLRHARLRRRRRQRRLLVDRAPKEGDADDGPGSHGSGLWSAGVQR